MSESKSTAKAPRSTRKVKKVKGKGGTPISAFNAPYDFMITNLTVSALDVSSTAYTANLDYWDLRFGSYDDPTNLPAYIDESGEAIGPRVGNDAPIMDTGNTRIYKENANLWVLEIYVIADDETLVWRGTKTTDLSSAAGTYNRDNNSGCTESQGTMQVVVTP